MKKVRAHIIIKGDVQGVFFRAHTEERARALGLTGWVKNTRAGDVEALFEGSEDKVKEAIALCRQGPPSAIVESVDVKYEKYQGKFNSFERRY